MIERLRQPRNLALAIVAIVAIVGAIVFLTRDEKPEDLTYTEFQNEVQSGEVEKVTLKDRANRIEGELQDGTKFRVEYPREFADEVTELVTEAKPEIEFKVDPQQDGFWTDLFWSIFPIVLLLGGFLAVLSMFQGGPRGAMNFGKSKARKFDQDEPSVTFDDVAGADEAIEELAEIKDFLKNPERFHEMGAKIPKGVLLYGPPGTGKTLLARAVAGEAGAPFFSISGSDFVEMFVGVGASRVRDLFEQAKQNAPAIIFIDEIDAVGRHRGAGHGGGHDEREQTLNQLLVEMDGFDANTGVIMIAATNRPDILDPALLRPGRFDRQIVVDHPDLNGRRKILAVHAKGKPLADDVDLDIIARTTPGFTGADLANLLNESALLAARRNKKLITMDEVHESVERVIAGPERATRLLSEREKRTIAYHEAGHAVVGRVLTNTHPIHKATIIPRGQALGYVLSLPEEDRVLTSRSELRDQVAMALGGRTAEEIVFGDITSGAADDIAKVTQMARNMVMRYGMSEVLGPQAFGNTRDEVFLGKEMGHEANYSDEIASRIDAEIASIIDIAHEEARAVLTTHRDVLDRLAEALIERETLDESELTEIFGELQPWNSSAWDAPTVHANGSRDALAPQDAVAESAAPELM